MLTKDLKMKVPERTPAELLLRHSAPAQPWQLATPQPILRVGGMSPYRPTRREFLIGAAGLLVLAPFGCGGESDEGENATGDTRTVEHALGETQVPAQPQRIVTTDGLALSFLVALEEQPIASATTGAGEFPETLAPLVEGEVRPLGDPENGLPYERIAEIGPDLIIGYDALMEVADSDAYAKLSEIAPTLAVAFNQSDRLEPMLDFGRALGKTDEAEAELEEFDAFIERSAQRLGGDPGTVAVMDASAPGTFTLYSEDFYFSSLVARLGFEFAPEVQQIEGYDEEGARAEELSLERLPLLESAETIVALDPSGFGEEDTNAFQELLGNPLWQQLPAVRNDRVVTVSRLDVFGNSGIIGYEEVIEKFVEAVEGFQEQ